MAGFSHAADPLNTDAFGRLRVSSPRTLFDSKFVVDAESLIWDDQQTAGGGTSSTWSATRSSVTLGVGNLTAGTRVRQTFRRMRYEPGKSQLVNMTFVLGARATGITRRIGCYSATDGVFLEQTSAGLSIVKRSNVSGSPVDTAVAQASWNVDPLNGTGPSLATFDETKAQLMQIDYQWLGTGTVRVGFFIGDQFVVAHKFTTANSGTSAWASTGNFPLRVEISNSGTGPAATIEQICSAVLSEGGTESVGLILAANTGSTAITAASVGTSYALVGIQLQTGAKGTSLNLLRVTIVDSSANDVFLWRAILNPTVAGTFTYGAYTNSSLNTATGAATNTVTGGTVIDCGYAVGKAEVSILPTSLVRLGFSIADVADSLVIATTPVVGTNQAMYASMTWQELV